MTQRTKRLLAKRKALRQRIKMNKMRMELNKQFLQSVVSFKMYRYETN